MILLYVKLRNLSGVLRLDNLHYTGWHRETRNLESSSGSPQELVEKLEWNPFSYTTTCHLIITNLWIYSQRAFVVEAFYKNVDDLIAPHREFRYHCNVGRQDCVSSCHAIMVWFEEMGSIRKNHSDLN